MTRLTQATRDKMAKALTRHKLDARAADLLVKNADLFNAVYLERYPVEIQTKMAKLPDGAFGKTNQFHENIRGMYLLVRCISVGSQYCRWQAKIEPRPVFHKSQWRDLSETTQEMIYALAMERETFAEDVKASYRTAHTAFGQFATVKKLSDEWPEVLPVIEHLIPDNSRTVPVLATQSLNSEFGLTI